jgi:hypothetical protein
MKVPDATEFVFVFAIVSAALSERERVVIIHKFRTLSAIRVLS